MHLVLSPMLLNIVLNFLTLNIMQQFLLSVSFADSVGLASETVAKWKQIPEVNELRVSESMFLLFSGTQALSILKCLGSVVNVTVCES